MEAFRAYSPIDPEAEENMSAVVMAFNNQVMPDIRQKLQKMDGIADKTIQELLAVAQGVHNNRETPEDKWMGVIAKANAKQTQNLARIFLGATSGDPDEKKCQLKLPTRGQGKDPMQGSAPGCRKISVLIARKWDTELKIAPKSPNINTMTWDATPAMCLLQNLATTVTRGHRIWASSLSLGEHSKWRGNLQILW